MTPETNSPENQPEAKLSDAAESQSTPAHASNDQVETSQAESVHEVNHPVPTVEAVNDATIVDPVSSSPSSEDPALVDEASVATDEVAPDAEGQRLEELQQETSYAELGRAELLVRLTEAAKEEDLDASRNRIKKIVESFEILQHEEKENKFKEFLLSGGLKEEFHYNGDEIFKKYDELIRKYNKARTEHRRNKEKLLKDNLEEKKKIIEELKSLSVTGSNLKASFDKLHELQTRWRAVGFVPKQFNDDLWQNYRYHIDRFYDILKINKDLRELDQKKNLEVKMELCERAEDLLLEPSINKSMGALHILQDKWKSSGPVAKEQSETIWQRFKSVSDKLFERRREHISVLEKQQNENLDIKNQLCERLEKLLIESPKTHKQWQEQFKNVEALMDEWKKSGFAPRKENEKIWKRFREARKGFFDARDAFFENIRKENTHNLNLKTDLCIQAEALQDSTDWRATADILKKLQEQWKKVGPTSYKHSEKIWNRFRTACDKFFANRNGHFEGMETKMVENLKLKNELLARMEHYTMSEDQAGNIDAIKKFQKEWMEFEPIPQREREKISQSYHATLDKLFNTIQKGQPNGNELVMKLKVEHKSSSPRGQEELRMEKSRIQDKIARLQKDVLQLETNVEFFGRSKNAMKMKEEFLEKINTSRDEIKSLKDHLKLLTNTAASN